MPEDESKNERTASVKDQREQACTRTRLANMRTFLAWCRTTLSLMAFGFLLEKVDIFLLNSHTPLSKALLGELGTLGRLAFVAGPILLLVAGWRYHRLEKELGYGNDGLFVIPEALLVGIITLSAVIYLVR